MNDMTVTLGPDDTFSNPQILPPNVGDIGNILEWDQENPDPASAKGCIVNLMTRVFYDPTSGAMAQFTREFEFRADGRVKKIGPEILAPVFIAVECP